MNDRKETDWTAYYSRRKSIFSTFTQRFTIRELLSLIDYWDKDIVELGGGNSCFANDICRMKDIKRYDIIDNNELAVEQFKRQCLETIDHEGYRANLLEEGMLPENKYDFVYSVGLIEHFMGKDIDTVIGRHFECCKPGGTVCITFPTPTIKYRIIRKCMEALGAWQFHDETPLKYADVQKSFERRGTVIKKYINSKLPLTQMIVVAVLPK